MALKAVKEYESLYFRMVDEIAEKYEVSANDVIFGAHEYFSDFCNTKWVQEYQKKLRMFNEAMAERFELSPREVTELHRDVLCNVHAKLRRKIIKHINSNLALAYKPVKKT